MVEDKYPEDKHWPVVLALAKKHGFILKADKSTAMLATHEKQVEQYGEDGYRKIQDMNRK